MSETEAKELIEFDSENTERLDVFLVRILGQVSQEYSRAQIQQHVRSGHVFVNEASEIKPSRKLVQGDKVAYSFPKIVPAYSMEPFDIPLSVLYEDDQICVIDKSAGLTMHPGTGNRNQTLVNALVARYGGDALLSESQRCGVVHRLDKDTSGIVVVARSPLAHRMLAAQFAERTVSRRYLGLLVWSPRRREGPFAESSGVLEGAIGRSKSNPIAMEIREDGKAAKTHFEVVERFEYGLLVRFRLETGRTHQIRVHAASVGCALVGDPVYGQDLRLPRLYQEAARKLARQALHAERLGFIHPSTGEQLEFVSALPEDMERCIAVFRAGGPGV